MFEIMKLKRMGYNVVKIDSDIINDKNILDAGSHGTIYNMSNNQCFKMWKDASVSAKYIDKINRFSKLNISCAAFPHNLVLIRDKIKGYTMDFIDGKTMHNCGDLDFTKFILMYSNYIEAISSEISDKKILMEDVFVGNIMFDKINNRFIGVDVDSWQQVNRSKELINYKNFKKLILTMGDCLFLSKDCDMYDDAININKDTDFIDFYETLRSKLEKAHKVKIKTVDDFKCPSTLKKYGR